MKKYFYKSLSFFLINVMLLTFSGCKKKEEIIANESKLEENNKSSSFSSDETIIHIEERPEHTQNMH